MANGLRGNGKPNSPGGGRGKGEFLLSLVPSGTRTRISLALP
ncbi:hypothetical protein [Moorena sp. SIO3B2]|nr:hypothetical protein [Moorena sp. SIO3B2]